MAVEQLLPRGIRHNNPGNIRRSNAAWAGLAANQTDPSFVVFTSPEYGIRALARILLNYQSHYALDTTETLIQRWAPPNENLTDAYVNAVSAAVGARPDDHIDFRHNPAILRSFVVAIIAHENGSPQRFGRSEWYDHATIDRGLAMAAQAPAQPHEDRSHHHHHRHRNATHHT